ncbi:N-acetylglucosamine-6-phosphate deacetylase [Maritimibacter fusiformis]|uniref:N-acetylglucosamine-6-phosphate deacetylase n=1 Tax=Maritimibacter fusiformis TaxID=2603819 RepID=A0A5D0RS98_9RHOB|nr:N-acetylglucosamine-6-phosphate deacetylase [Maritimibacter fusiformis]TYB83518.1 N-acetylglucosamine-6-phosphate deacetylase [Maritimibacter fusiformis]
MQDILGTAMTPHGPRAVRIAVAEGRIAEITPDSAAGDALILPGFIDLHCHGGGGDDVMDGDGAAARIAVYHAQTGTTAMLATTMTAPVDRIRSVLGDVGRAMAAPAPGAAEILGVHLEGPFISPDMLGAQPACAREIDLGLLDAFDALAPLRVLTYAPEADPEGRLLAFARARGIRAQLGHSPCPYETAEAAFRDGAGGATHLFNAMSPLHHRAPGLVGAALAHADHAELIPDLLHVHPGAIRAALRAIPGLYAVTDATRATGMPDGSYPFGEITATKCGNGLRLADGTLAGSCLSMLQAFRNLVEIGLPPSEAARRCATLQADYLGLYDRGRIATGAVADLVILAPDLTLREVVLRGR